MFIKQKISLTCISLLIGLFSSSVIAKPAVLDQPSTHLHIVDYGGDHEKGSIVINIKERKLLYVLDDLSAIEYQVAVGKRGSATPKREYKIENKAKWPIWYPTEEMRKKDKKLPKKIPGGPHNPLGARALYLDNSLIRIHGTNDPRSIGRAASHGCIRMRNGDVIDLYSRANVGTHVFIE